MAGAVTDNWRPAIAEPIVEEGELKKKMIQATPDLFDWPQLHTPGFEEVFQEAIIKGRLIRYLSLIRSVIFLHKGDAGGQGCSKRGDTVAWGNGEDGG